MLSAVDFKLGEIKGGADGEENDGDDDDDVDDKEEEEEEGLRGEGEERGLSEEGEGRGGLGMGLLANDDCDRGCDEG